MVDWFVVLTPLLLIPIVFPFVCVGCVLTREGRAIPVSLVYQIGLDDVDSIEVHVDVSGLINEEDDSNVDSLPSIQTGDIELGGSDEARRLHFGKIPSTSSGTIVYTCTLTMLGDEGQIEAAPKVFEKVEDEHVPEFRLERAAPVTQLPKTFRIV